jgi:membrane-bound metal-dependent hydrolase YbcI (DUF457 family)
MPFTPFHMGPGVAVKAVSGRHFSLMVFGFSQVAIDIEPLVRILRGDSLLHGFTHTYLGATLIGLVSVVVGRPVCQFFLNFWVPDESTPFLYWLRCPQRISWSAAFVGAFVGTYSHIVLDSFMHADMQPFAPLPQSNALLHLISVAKLHAICLFSGLFGAVLIFLVFAGPRATRRL